MVNADYQFAKMKGFPKWYNNNNKKNRITNRNQMKKKATMKKQSNCSTITTFLHPSTAAAVNFQ